MKTGIDFEDFKLEKGQRTKQRNRILVDLISKIWDSKKLKNRKTDRTVGLNFCISNISSGTA